MRWMPGQLTRLAELQQQQRDEEDEEESGTVSRTRMLGSDAALLIICANRCACMQSWVWYTRSLHI